MTNLLNAFYNVDNETDGIAGATELNGASTPLGVKTSGGTYVYVAGDQDAGVQIFEMDRNGQLTAAGGLFDDAVTDITRPTDLDHFQIGNDDYIMIKGYFSLTTALIDPITGGLTVVDTESDDASTQLQGYSYAAMYEINDRLFTLVTSDIEDAISVFEIDSDGFFVPVQEIDDLDNASYELNAVDNVTIVETGGNLFAVTAGAVDDGLSVWQAANDGTLTNVDNVQDTGALELDGVVGLGSADVDGTMYVYAAGRNDNGISVFSMNGNGILTNVQNYDFSFGFAVLDGPVYFTIREYEGAEIMVVPAIDDDLLVAYSLNPGGELVEIGRLFDSSTLELDGVLNTNFINVGGTDFLLATGNIDDGISVFEVGGDDDVVGGTDEADFIFGFAGDDVLAGQDGNDNLFGGDGVDVLTGGRNRDVLNGGADGDVLAGGLGEDTASYRGSDRAVEIDLSAGLATGGDATGDTLIDIENVIGSDNADTITGDAGKNNLVGEDGNDTIDGQDGNDRLVGGQGNDELTGGEGNDRLKGNDGGDLLIGNAGVDRLIGGAGSDAMFGGSNNDIMFGQSGSDAMRGGGGNDEMYGGGSNDTLTGDAGDDTLTGEAGADVFVINDGDGSDFITDFENGTDLIDLSGNSAVNFGDISSIQFGDDLLVTIDSTETVVLQNFLKADLNGADFIFT
ncbi:MAG: calcium-binding protein [Pseudomonadota bacterium]